MPTNAKVNCTGSKLKEVRLKAGISRNLLSREVSEITPISEARLTSIEEGTAQIYDFELKALAEVLKISVDDIFN